ncbi:MAG: hypothetical protein HY238_18550 [Acidobacteria bacterium]|nr:hypothetical protein [Acidobacteriota bacterium]
MRIATVTGLLALLAWTAAAADVTGKWKAEFDAGGQTRVNTFDFKVAGGKLTGMVTGSQGGPAQISDGKVSGDEISFWAMRNIGGEEVKVVYKGKISGDTIQFQVQFGDRDFEMTAKRMPT